MQWVASNACHARSLFRDDLLHGPGGFVGIDVAELAAVDDQHLARFFPAPLYPFEQLAFQFMNVFMQSGCREKQMLRIQKALGFKMIQFQGQCAAGNDCYVGKRDSSHESLLMG
jgi:hypothetical protein